MDLFVTRVSTGTVFSLAITKEKTLYVYGSTGFLGMQQVSRPSPVMQVSSQNFVGMSVWGHALAMTETGSVYAIGSNERGQLGVGDNIPHTIPIQIDLGVIGRRFKAISAGRTHSLIVHMNGNIFSFGSNNFGELGNTNPQPLPRKVQLLPSGQNYHVLQIATGYLHTLVLTDKGLIGFGYSFVNNHF
jgi:alpha-tubulin suppressor-like RCC1 family protein